MHLIAFFMCLSWHEGVITAKDEKDETSLSVSFPGTSEFNCRTLLQATLLGCFEK